MFLIDYKPRKCNQKLITFKNVLKCAYAVYLDANEKVRSWRYRENKLRYINSFTGEPKFYACSFTIIYNDGIVENVEVDYKQYPLDKYLYAQNQIHNWRWITQEEIDKAEELFYNGKNMRYIQFRYFTRNMITWIILSKIKNPKLSKGLRIDLAHKVGAYYELMIYNKNYKQQEYKRYDINRIIKLAKKYNQKTIAAKIGTHPSAIRRILESNGYYIKWSKFGNTIYKNGKMIYKSKF